MRSRHKNVVTSFDIVDNNQPTQTDSTAGPAEAYADVVSSNEEHLSACKKVVLAFKATKAAQLEMQKCLAEEEKLLQQLQGPPQEAAAKTKQLINRTAEHFRNIEPSREQRHAKMLIRQAMQHGPADILPNAIAMTTSTHTDCARWDGIRQQKLGDAHIAHTKLEVMSICVYQVCPTVHSLESGPYKNKHK